MIHQVQASSIVDLSHFHHLFLNAIRSKLVLLVYQHFQINPSLHSSWFLSVFGIPSDSHIYYITSFAVYQNECSHYRVFQILRCEEWRKGEQYRWSNFTNNLYCLRSKGEICYLWALFNISFRRWWKRL